MNSLAGTDVEPGQILAGKFRIEKVLGRGGMGVVVAATHIHLDQQVALKFLLPEALENAEAVRRFEREARAAVKIRSEHVARVTDVGKLESGAPYMVMEYLSGMDLGEYLTQQGPLAFDDACDALLQACEAIAEAHSLGIVHRDLKPANLFRITRSDGTPSIKVLDFGISKVTSGDDKSMTNTSSLMGSPYYMSPEQMISSKNVDGRTDIWALGIILHELLSGKVPYQGETIPEICAQVLQSAPPKLTELREGTPAELEAVIATALAKKREDRYEDVAGFAAAIAPFGGPHAQQSVARIRKILGLTHTVRLSTPDLDTTGAPTTPGPARNGAQSLSEVDPGAHTTLTGAAHTQLDYTPPISGSKWPLAVAALLIVAAGGAFVLFRGQEQDATEAASPVIAAPSGPSAEEDAEAKAAEAKAAQAKAQEEQAAALKREAEQLRAQQDAAALAAQAPPPVATPAAPPTAAARTAKTKRSTPAPQPAPSPAPAPAPAPEPVKKPSSSLFLDRK